MTEIALSRFPADQPEPVPPIHTATSCRTNILSPSRIIDLSEIYARRYKQPPWGRKVPSESLMLVVPHDLPIRGPWLNNREACKLRQHSIGCIISNLKCWPLNEIIHQSLSYLCPYRLGCVSEGYENSRLIDYEGVQSGQTPPTNWLADIC